MRNIGSRYTISDDPLGRGASGTVYPGTDQQGNQVAVKILYPHLTHDPQVVSKFTQERRVLAGVRDPHIVNVLDLVAEGDTLAIVMEYVDGPNLHEWLTAGSAVTASTVAQLGGDIARGLAALHAADVVHCDLKPANILIATEEAGPNPKISDFGISTILSEASESTTVMGTPRYMAPERLRHEPATTASDVYALGMVVYEIAAGIPAFSGSTQQIAKAQLELTPGRLESVPRPLWDVIEACLEKNPAARPSADRVAAALERILPSLDTQTALPRHTTPPVPQAVGAAPVSPSGGETAPLNESAEAVSAKSRSKAVPVLIAAGLLAALAAALFAWTSRSNEEPAAAASPVAQASAPPSATPQLSSASPTAPMVSPTPVALVSLQPKGGYSTGQVGVDAQLAGSDQVYPNSIVGGLIRNAEKSAGVTYQLKRQYETFEATLGMDASSAPDGCTISITGDQGEVLDPDLDWLIFRYDTPPYPITIPVDDVYTLQIDGECDEKDAAVVIGNPRLTPKVTVSATPSEP